MVSGTTGDMDKIWILDNEAALENWVVTSDSDHGEGFSSGSLTISPTGHGLFSGHISTRVSLIFCSFLIGKVPGSSKAFSKPLLLNYYHSVTV